MLLSLVLCARCATTVCFVDVADDVYALLLSGDWTEDERVNAAREFCSNLWGQCEYDSMANISTWDVSKLDEVGVYFGEERQIG